MTYPVYIGMRQVAACTTPEAQAAAMRLLGGKRFVCQYCEDSHTVAWLFADDGFLKNVACTACPVPCEKCRDGAYCREPACECDCHERGERR